MAPGATNMSMNFSSFTANSSVPTARNNLSRLHSIQREKNNNKLLDPKLQHYRGERANQNLKQVQEQWFKEKLL
jgi:hypothetical protein